MPDQQFQSDLNILTPKGFRVLSAKLIIKNKANSCSFTNIPFIQQAFMKYLKGKLLAVRRKPWAGLPLQKYSHGGCHIGHRSNDQNTLT